MKNPVISHLLCFLFYFLTSTSIFPPVALLKARHRSLEVGNFHVSVNFQAVFHRYGNGAGPGDCVFEFVLVEIVFEPFPEDISAEVLFQHVDDGGPLLVADGVKDCLNLLGVTHRHGDRMGGGETVKLEGRDYHLNDKHGLVTPGWVAGVTVADSSTAMYH